MVSIKICTNINYLFFVGKKRKSFFAEIANFVLPFHQWSLVAMVTTSESVPLVIDFSFQVATVKKLNSAFCF